MLVIGVGKNNLVFLRKVKWVRTENGNLVYGKGSKPLKAVWFLTASEEIGLGVKVSAHEYHFGHEQQQSIWALVEDPLWLPS